LYPRRQCRQLIGEPDPESRPDQSFIDTDGAAEREMKGLEKE